MVGKNLHFYLLHILGSVSLTLAVSSTDSWTPTLQPQEAHEDYGNKQVQDIFNLLLLRVGGQSRGEKCTEFMGNALSTLHTYTDTCVPC